MHPEGLRKAKAFAASCTMREMSAPRVRAHERFDAWAHAYFSERYSNSGSLKNALTSLRDLMVYLAHVRVGTPRQVDYKIAAGYMPWRISNKDLQKTSVNTARLRFVYFSVLMGEAVRRGFCPHNPCRDVKRKHEPPKEKLEITAEHQREIEAALRDKPQWMRDQWLVLMRQGCRVAETNVPLERITDTTITFKLKGGKMHTAALHPDLLPLVRTARAEGRAMLIDGPPVGSWSPIWSDFFHRRGLPYSAHCTRVTVITRLLRANHSPAKVCAFIGHSEEINRIYRRLQPPDSAELLNTLAAVPSQR